MHPAQWLFWIALSTLGGIAAAVFEISVVATLVSGLGVGIFLTYKKKLPWLLVFVIHLCIAGGMFYTHVHGAIAHSRLAPIFDKEIGSVGKIVDEPQSSENVQWFTLALEEPSIGNARLLVSSEHNLHYGDKLSFRGTIESPERAGEIPVAFFPNIERVERTKPTVRKVLLDAKERFVHSFRIFLSGDKGALLAGLTFGIRDEFTSEFKEAMRESGTTHLVALSGYNILILVLAVFGTLTHFARRRIAFFTTCTAIALFVTMVGFEPSIVRAAAMGFFALTAKELGRLPNFLHTAVLAAIGMLLWNPFWIREAGFQLSFASLLGIFYVTPKIKEVFHLREHVATTLGAQCAVIPVVIGHFGEFSLGSFLANILILPFIPFTMFLGFLLIGTYLFLAPLASIVAWLVTPLLSYEIYVINLFAHLPFPSVEAWISPIIFGIAYYPLLLLFLFSRKNENYGRR